MPNLIAAVLAVAVLAAFGAGMRLRRPKPEVSVTGSVVGALLALFSLLLAFSFSAAWARFDRRLSLAIDEANAVGTLTVRLSLTGPGRAEAERALLDYVRERLQFSADLARSKAGDETVRRHRDAAARLAEAVMHAAAEIRDAPDRALVVQGLNQVLDLGATRRIESETRVPTLVVLVLGLTGIAGALVAGREIAWANAASQRAGWAFAVCVAFTLYAVFDMQNPRVGLIRIDHADVLLKETERQLAGSASAGRP